MDMHWIVLKDLESLPKDKPFLVSFKYKTVFMAQWMESFKQYCVINEFGIHAIMESDYLNNDQACWMRMPNTPEPKDPSHYLNYN